MSNTYKQHRADDGSDSERFVADDGPSRANGGAHSSAPVMRVQPLRTDDLQPSYAYMASDATTHDHGAYGSFMNCLGNLIGCIGAVPCAPCPNPFKEVKQGSVGLITRFGRFYRAVDPGLIKVNPATESIRTVDVKVQILQVPQQTVMTKDNVSVGIDSVVVWHVVNPYRAAFAVGDVRLALSERAQTTLRQVVGNRTLQSTITEREAIALEIEQIIDSVSEQWGVSVESILIKDINFSNELQQSLSSAATQKRIGESKIIAARAEVDAAKLMREAADILSSPAAIQIRQLEALQAMAKGAGRVLFVPMSLQSIGNMDPSALAQNDPAHGGRITSTSSSSAGNPIQTAGLLSAMANDA